MARSTLGLPASVVALAVALLLIACLGEATTAASSATRYVMEDGDAGANGHTIASADEVDSLAASKKPAVADDFEYEVVASTSLLESQSSTAPAPAKTAEKVTAMAEPAGSFIAAKQTVEAAKETPAAAAPATGAAPAPAAAAKPKPAAKDGASAAAPAHHEAEHHGVDDFEGDHQPQLDLSPHQPIPDLPKGTAFNKVLPRGGQPFPQRVRPLSTREYQVYRNNALKLSKERYHMNRFVFPDWAAESKTLRDIEARRNALYAPVSDLSKQEPVYSGVDAEDGSYDEVR